MLFNITDKPPEGIEKYITPEAYATLDEEGQYCYVPEWKEYRTKKVRDYSECGDCGHREFLGWVDQDVPIGAPYRYVYQRPFMPYQLIRSIQQTEVDAINSSNVLYQRLMKEKYKE